MRVKAENFGKPYTDAQVRDILSVAPTMANAKAKAEAYGRNPGAIIQLWRWANTPDKRVREYEVKFHNGKPSKYHRQLLRVRRSMGWVMV